MNKSLKTLAVCAVLVVAITPPETSFASVKGASLKSFKQRLNSKKAQSDSSLLRKGRGNQPCESGPDTLSRTQSDALVNGQDAAKQIIDPETRRANVFKSITSATKAMHTRNCFKDEGIFRLSAEKLVIDALVQESEKSPLEFLGESHNCDQLAGFIKASFRKENRFDIALYEKIAKKIPKEDKPTALRDEPTALRVEKILNLLAEKLGPEGTEAFKEVFKAFQLVIQNKASTRYKDGDAFAVAVATSMFPLETGNNIQEGFNHVDRAKNIFKFILNNATEDYIAKMGSQKSPLVETHQHPQHSDSQMSLDDTQSPESSSNSLSSSRAGSRRPSSPTLPHTLLDAASPDRPDRPISEVPLLPPGPQKDAGRIVVHERPAVLEREKTQRDLQVRQPSSQSQPEEVSEVAKAAREKPHPLLKQQGNMSLVPKAEAPKNSTPTTDEKSKLVDDLRAQREWARDTTQLKENTEYRVRILRGGAKTEINCTQVTEESDGIHCYDARDKSTLVIQKSDFKGFRERSDSKGESN